MGEVKTAGDSVGVNLPAVHLDRLGSLDAANSDASEDSRQTSTTISSSIATSESAFY